MFKQYKNKQTVSTRCSKIDASITSPLNHQALLAQ